MRLLIVVGILALSALPASASLPEPAGVFRYQLRALGASAGEVALTIGEPTRTGRQTVRQVRIEARTTGFVARAHPAFGDGTAIVDDAFQPRRLTWSADLAGQARGARVRIGPRSVRGTYRRAGVASEPFVYRSDAWPLDSVSAYAWLPRQDLTPGNRLERPLFDGRRLSTLVATVGRPRTLHTPMGTREAIPVHVTITRPPVAVKGAVPRARSPRRMTLWIGPSDRVLYRVEARWGALGRVTADLVGVRRPGSGGLRLNSHPKRSTRGSGSAPGAS